jgi:hypothetical protein
VAYIVTQNLRTGAAGSQDELRHDAIQKLNFAPIWTWRAPVVPSFWPTWDVE